MMNPCFIHCYVPTQKILFITRKQLQTALRIMDSLLLCSTVSKRGTHLEYNFFVLKFSCTTLNTVPFDIFRMSAISCNFTFRSDKIIFRICVFGSSRLSWTTWALRVFGVCSTAFKICIPSANGCFRWGIFPVTLFKPLLSSNGIFTHQRTVFD